MLAFEASPWHTCQVCVSTDTQQAAALLTHSRQEPSHSCSTSARAKSQTSIKTETSVQETPESDSGAAWLKQVVTNRKWFTYAELYKYLLAEEEEEALSRCFRKWKPWMWVLNKKWRWGESQLGRKLSHEVKQRRLDWLLTYQTELQHKELWLASSSWLWGVWPIRFLPAAALQEGLELNHWSSVKCAHLYLIIIFGLNTGKKTGSLVAQISELTSCPADKQSVGAGETGSVRSATCHITASLQHQLMIKQREQRKHVGSRPVPHGRQNTCWGKVC